ncbi:unnamed protein product [Danaus chrysippus]|uniref:(African queen) hypothetical protein n=1 Tax=Danaus chrysippus TaxID=151541 RepID=A0A8J2RJE8_9NEOP|nr:unnamed protein product [Danaus chrysippus]
MQNNGSAVEHQHLSMSTGFSIGQYSASSRRNRVSCCSNPCPVNYTDEILTRKLLPYALTSASNQHNPTSVHKQTGALFYNKKLTSMGSSKNQLPL